jgi:hypothetical protein
MVCSCYVQFCKNATKKSISKKKAAELAEMAAKNINPGPKYPYKMHRIPKVSTDGLLLFKFYHFIVIYLKGGFRFGLFFCFT